jgi:hypothetical protein
MIEAILVVIGVTVALWLYFFVVPAIIGTIIMVSGKVIGGKIRKWWETSNARRVEKKIEREELIESIRVEKIIKYQEAFEQRQKKTEEEYRKYLDFRKQIEQMPIYERWRQDVIKKCGNQCQLNRSHSNRKTEVHHIDSLYLIYLGNNLTSNEKIIKCKKLWDIDNGIVLCEECHDTMESSKNRRTLIQNKN